MIFTGHSLKKNNDRKNQQENTSFTQIDHLDVYDSSYLLYRKWFLLSNLLFYRETEETAAKEILSSFSSSGEDPSAEGNDVEEDARPKVMYTDIKGSVKEPGIYSFSSEERVYDVLKRAGGLLEEADSDRINFSAKIEDQQVLYIPAVGEELPEHLDQLASSEGKQPTADSEPPKININTATPSELQQIPGSDQSKRKKSFDLEKKRILPESGRPAGDFWYR